MNHINFVANKTVSCMKHTLSTILVLFLSLCLTGCHFRVHRDEDTVITFDQLPDAACDFLQKHFSGITIKEIVCERRASLAQYEVELKGGIDVQFDRNGICTEINCKKSAVPDAAMPTEIVQQINERFPGHFVMKYEHDSRIYDIELDDGTELTFNRSLRLIDVDRF